MFCKCGIFYSEKCPGHCSVYLPGKPDTFITPDNLGVDVQQTGDDLIADERFQQVMKHGRSIHDDLKVNPNGELVQMARALIEFNWGAAPKNWDRGLVDRMMNKTYSQRLVIAGALLAAEIDRVNLLAQIHAANAKSS
jgi:hypothetical protein